VVDGQTLATLMVECTSESRSSTPSNSRPSMMDC